MASGEHPSVRPGHLAEFFDKVETEYRATLRKCSSEREADPSGVTNPFMRRAKRVFIEAVGMHKGGNEEVAGLVPCNESNIRWQKRNPDRSPQLNVIYAMSPDAMEHVADDLRAAAEEKRRVRRAG